MNEKNINVLYVDDEKNNLISFTATFRKDFTIYSALSSVEAEIILTNHEIHVLITDQRMPGTLGTELLADVVKKYPNQIRILLTAYTDTEAIIDAINRGQIFKYLTKPWDNEILKKSIIDGYEIYLKNLEKEEIIKNLELTIKELNNALKNTSI